MFTAHKTITKHIRNVLKNNNTQFKSATELLAKKKKEVTLISKIE